MAKNIINRRGFVGKSIAAVACLFTMKQVGAHCASFESAPVPEHIASIEGLVKREGFVVEPNMRFAIVANTNGSTELCRFEQLKKGDVFRLYDTDGHAVIKDWGLVESDPQPTTAFSPNNWEFVYSTVQV